MPQAALHFDNSYARLPERFYSRQQAEPVAKPGPVRVNRALAAQLGIDPDWLASPEGTAVLAGNHLPEGADPIAQVYAGHQFGGWNPQLGDGRAILLGELIDLAGSRYDIQLKGSGRTPYSRGGDGRAPLGAVLREYIVSEAMAAMGIPSTRSLAAVTSGETVLRDKPLPGGVLARVAQSHIRIGTFQFFAAREDSEALRLLAEHVIDRHYPEAAEAQNPCLVMLERVIDRQAELLARWQLVGFIHGVMNTDNMLLSGETIDYGPCAFMDGFHPNAVYSSIDHSGRYAYLEQPGIAHWNLVCLAKALLPLLDSDAQRALSIAQEAIDVFPARFEAAYRQGMNNKLGLAQGVGDDDTLVEDLLRLMTETRADFTLTFRRLADLAHPEGAAGKDVGDLYRLPEAFEPWLGRWRLRLQAGADSGGTAAGSATGPGELIKRQASMYAVNPAYIPRNHLVEEAIVAAENQQDFGPFHALVDRLSQPFDYDAAQARAATPPRPEQVVRQTFCGT